MKYSGGSVLKRIFSPVNNAKKVYRWGVFAGSTRFLFDIGTIWVFQQIAKFIETGNVEAIKMYLLGYSFFFLLFYVRKYFSRTRTWSINRPVLTKVIRKDVLERYFQLSLTEVEKMGTGKVLHLMQEGVSFWVRMLMEASMLVPNLVIKLLFALILLSQIGSMRLLLFIVMIGVLHVAAYFFNQRAYVYKKIHKDIAVLSSRLLIKMVMSKQEILQTDREKYEIEAYLAYIDQDQVYNLKRATPVFFMYNIPMVIVQSMGIVAMIYAYTSLSNDTFSLGTFTGLLMMIGYLVELILKSNQFLQEATDQYVHIERMRSFLDTTPVLERFYEGETFRYTNGDILFSDFSFGYGHGKPVFEGFTCSIGGGKKTALVGMSGSGKTTLIKLLVGQLRPDSGKVMVDGQNLHEVSLKSYYKDVGYLTQEPSVFDGTVRENLLYAVSEEVEPERINTILQSAKCEFVYDLPQGLETEIGERGIRLSGGQRQRLAIAKIFLKDPKIIILDEPTSALDSFSEEAITEAMHNLFEGRTVIIIAHRLQTVKAADEILVLDKQPGEGAQVIERGTHEELVKKGGYYARMLEVQTGF